MDVEILYMEVKPDSTRIAAVDIRYHDLLLQVDLVYYTKANKCWIRMPEVWIDHRKKSFCAWQNIEISDNFQKVVLKKIFDKYNLDDNKVKGIFLSTQKK